MFDAQSTQRHTRQQVFTKVATDVAVLLLIFGSMSGAWVMVIAAGIGMIGLVLYACLSSDPARNRYVLLAVLAAVVAGALASTAVYLW